MARTSVDHNNPLRYSVLFLVILPLALFLQEAGAAQQPSHFPPHAKPFGKSYRQWSAEWWQSLLSTPASVNPLNDPNGSFCMIGQRGPVWFLVGAFGNTSTANRTCTLPEGKAVFFPIVNSIDFNTPAVTGTDQDA